jgi:DNA-binding NarL/FixJ family response regulator
VERYVDRCVADALRGAQPVARRTSPPTSAPTSLGSHVDAGAESPVDRLGLDPRLVRSTVARIAATHYLSAREMDVLAAAVCGVPRSRVAEALGRSENTIKTQVNAVLKKLGQAGLDDAVWWVRSQVPAIP